MQQNPHNNKVPSVSKNLLICWDSNRKFIDTRRLCNLKTTEFVSTATLDNVYHTVNRCTHVNLQTIFIHCGTNDAEQQDISSLLKSFHEIVLLIKNKYSEANIIISKLLPRKDGINRKVSALNRALDAEFSNMPNVSVISHNNINNSFNNTANGNFDSILTDDKHLAQTAAPMFAGNIKYALRKANALPDTNQSDPNAKMFHGNRISSNSAPTSDTTNDPSKKTQLCEAMMQVLNRFF